MKNKHRILPLASGRNISICHPFVEWQSACFFSILNFEITGVDTTYEK